MAGIEPSLSTADLPAYYHPGRSAAMGGVALFGELHPDHAESIKIRPRVYLAEIDIERLLDAESAHRVEAIPRYPSIRRDFSLVLRKETTYEDVRQAIVQAGIPELARVEPFDRLESGAFPETHYGLSVSVVYRSPERTLLDTEVEGFDRRILEILKERLGAQLRS
jgi:phenylalanyl-tRNA synthetase beta chain